jgi:hypothetical protein
MGTSGTDKFHEYREPGKSVGEKGTSKKKGGPTSGSARGGASGGGPKTGANKCAEPITNANLEDVARCPYFGKHKNVPPTGTAVSVSSTLVHGRVAVITDDGEVVGYLPVEYSYVRRCIEQGFSYSGHVASSSLKPIEAVRVTLSASQQ